MLPPHTHTGGGANRSSLLGPGLSIFEYDFFQSFPKTNRVVLFPPTVKGTGDRAKLTQLSEGRAEFRPWEHPFASAGPQIQATVQGFPTS